MLRSLALAVSVFAFSGAAVAECGAGHGAKDAMATTDKLLASNASTAKPVALPASVKQAPDSAGKPAPVTKVARKPASPAAKERLASALQCDGRPCE